MNPTLEEIKQLTPELKAFAETRLPAMEAEADELWKRVQEAELKLEPHKAAYSKLVQEWHLLYNKIQSIKALFGP